MAYYHLLIYESGVPSPSILTFCLGFNITHLHLALEVVQVALEGDIRSK